MKLLYVFDLNGTQTAVLEHDVQDLIHDEMLDTSETLTFNMPIGPMTDKLVEDGEIFTEGRRFTIRSVRKNRSGPKAKVFIKAEAYWYKLLLHKKVGSFSLSGVTVLAGLNSILEGTLWVANATSGLTPDTGSFSMEEQDKSVLELIRKWASITNTKVVFNTTGLWVALQTERGAVRGETFRYGRNIDEVDKETIPPDITVLYPYGADGLTIAGVNNGVPYLEDFSYYTSRGMTLLEARERFTKMEVIYNESLLVDTELLAWAQTQMDGLGQGDVFYKMRVKDLSEFTGFAEDRYRAGDRVAVYDEEIGIDLIADVVRIQRHPNNPRLNKVELAKLAPVLGNDTSASRPSTSRNWNLFGSKSFAYTLRNDGVFTTNRIPLLFRDGGEAFFGLGVQAVGVGAGVLHISIINGAEQTWPIADIPYTNGSQINYTSTFFYKDLVGQTDYRVRMWTTASGGPSATNGINIAHEASHFWIHAHGAVQQTPTLPNSVTFLPNGGNPDSGFVQSWIVPDNVTEVLVAAHGGPGGSEGMFANGNGGTGAKIVGRFQVVPGTAYDIYVGKWGDNLPGWPNGGGGGTGFSTSLGGGGGGSTHMVLAGGAFSSAIIVAAGGGGTGYFGQAPGNGGWTNGTNGAGAQPGGGATQFSGGTASGANVGSFNQGGPGGSTSGGFPEGQGGGGGGWYGGGGGGGAGGAGGGGGGSSWIDFSIGAVLEEVGVATIDDTGQRGGMLQISWEDPL